MWIARGLEHLALLGPTGLTIGSFDGVHRGHQALIQMLIRSAHDAGMQAVVLTFDPLPRLLFNPETQRLLSSLEERLEWFAEMEPDGVVVIPFDRETAAQSAEAFATHLLQHLGLKGLWIGPDFTIGRHREGTAVRLREIGAARGFEVYTVSPFLLEGEPVRSSRIRELLLNGDLAKANTLLGRPYTVIGTIVHGEKRGRILGFPTANLEVAPERLVPANGIYVCRAYLNTENAGVPTGESAPGIQRQLGAVTNIGTRPTFDHSETTIEAHLLDFSEEIYGATLRLEFLARLRPERRFNSAEALIAQIQQDKAAARAWLDGEV
ncbi:MAG: bifunctional riboflavin kinase/FAD synthetase [Anaerolineae bacterium]|jgi:riboflavin kinase/FMN adenylyltransferase|nr:bifunctional riboflavin kinase/FAD synthetase [Anaerolineae bacterium]